MGPSPRPAIACAAAVVFTWPLAAAALAFAMVVAAQMPWRVYFSMERYDDIPVPPDFQEKTEWIFARLMYPQNPVGRNGGFRGGFRGNRDWRDLIERQIGHPSPQGSQIKADLGIPE